jgi:hypothetical protein
MTKDVIRAADAKLCPGSSSRKPADASVDDSPETPCLTCAEPPPVCCIHIVQRKLGTRLHNVCEIYIALLR